MGKGTTATAAAPAATTMATMGVREGTSRDVPIRRSGKIGLILPQRERERDRDRDRDRETEINRNNARKRERTKKK